MTQQQWENLADHYEAALQTATKDNDEWLAEYYRAKVQTARINAAYGSEPREETEEL